MYRNASNIIKTSLQVSFDVEFDRAFPEKLKLIHFSNSEHIYIYIRMHETPIFEEQWILPKLEMFLWSKN